MTEASTTTNTNANDELGPELVVRVYDPTTGTRGFLVVDNSVLGPVGGGTRMAPDIDEQEVRDLARAMSYKFAYLGLPRGGSKAGIVADPNLPPDEKRAHLRAFGRGLRSFLKTKDVAVGPDMGVTAADVTEMYNGAGVPQVRTGLFTRMLDNDPAGYHLTGSGVICSSVATCKEAGIPFAGATIAVEGFGQVGVGTCRGAVREGAKVVAISTMSGAIYDPKGLDIPKLLELRREFGDACVLKYGNAQTIATDEIYFLPVDIVVPGARPWVITEQNCDRVQAKVVACAANISVTDEAADKLWARKVYTIPDFVANAGGLLGSLVDFAGGTVEQALAAIDRIMTPRAADVAREALKSGRSPRLVAIDRARELIMSKRGQAPRTFDDTMVEIRQLMGL